MLLATLHYPRLQYIGRLVAVTTQGNQARSLTATNKTKYTCHLSQDSNTMASWAEKS